MDDAISLLSNAADDLFSAADLLSDLRAEYHGNRGLGVPAKDARIEKLYAMSALVDAIIASLEEALR